MTSKGYHLLAWAFLVLCGISFVGVYLIFDQSFEEGCGSHLEKASNAVSIDEARRELRIAIDYIEDHGLTEGSTSDNPEDDLGQWYENLKFIQGELEGFGSASLTDQNVELLKVRPLLIKDAPSGIDYFPYNGLILLLRTFFFLGTVVSIVLGIRKDLLEKN